MSTQLQQLQLNYDQLQDRLVLTLFTNDWSEFQFWLTRKITQGLWKILIQLLNADQKTDIQHQQETQQVEKTIEQEKNQRQKEAEKYSKRLTRKPFGEEPLLIFKIMARPQEKGCFFLHLEDNKGQSIEFGGDSKMLIALCQLIKRVSKQADWHLDLEDII